MVSREGSGEDVRAGSVKRSIPVGSGRRGKMSPAERAKQFMPFAALKGYEEALRQKEKIVVEKIELSEEMK